ncbi:MAG TPA: YbaK/EbsC family protein [Porticoccus sp.]|nr:YbaK/EbsC family protein [Porticoccus sp.]
MSISARITSYLDEQDIKYDTINHLHTNTAAGTALTAHIPPNSMAKAVVLEDHDSRHLMAILPADHKVSLHKLNDTLGLDLHLVDEEQVYHMFSDCDQGAVPGIGQAYNMNSIYDEALDQLDDVYFEAGDHETLIHLNKAQFGKLMSNSKHSRFSSEIYY